MRAKRRLLFGTAFGASLVNALSASAYSKQAVPPPAIAGTAQEPPPFEVSFRTAYENPYTRSPVRLKFSSIHSDDLETGAADPYGGGPAFALTGAWRAVAPLAVGVDLRYRATVIASDVGGYDTLARHAFGADAFLRWYFAPGQRMDPWVSAGVGYVRDEQSYTGPAGGGFVASTTLEHEGLGLPLALGLDVRVVRPFWVGPYAGLEPTLGLSGAQSTSVSGSAAGDVSGDAITYVSWSAGLVLKLSVGKR